MEDRRSKMDNGGQRIAVFHPLSSILDLFHPCLKHIRHHSDKRRMIVGATDTNEIYAQVGRDPFRFDVQIIQNLHMIADKPDGRDDDCPFTVASQLPNDVADVGFEPRIGRVAAAALVRQQPARVVQSIGDQACAGFELPNVWRSRRHRGR